MWLRRSRYEFNEMMRRLQTYSATGTGAEQNFFMDFGKDKGGISVHDENEMYALSSCFADMCWETKQCTSWRLSCVQHI